MTKTKSTFLALIAILLSPMTANADLITTSIGDYDITTVTGTFDEVASDLMAQDWWGDGTLASEFSDALGDLLGTFDLPLPEGSLAYTPVFAYEATEGSFDGYLWVDFPGGSGLGPSSISGPRGIPLVWAVGERVSVPEPGTLALLGVGLFGIGFARRRKKV